MREIVVQIEEQNQNIHWMDIATKKDVIDGILEKLYLLEHMCQACGSTQTHMLCQDGQTGHIIRKVYFPVNRK